MPLFTQHAGNRKPAHAGTDDRKTLLFGGESHAEIVLYSKCVILFIANNQLLKCFNRKMFPVYLLDFNLCVDVISFIL